MLEHKRWAVLHNFELRQKRAFLKRLSTGTGMKIFKDLYQFGQKINRPAYGQIEFGSTGSFIRVHSIFMKVKA